MLLQGRLIFSSDLSYHSVQNCRFFRFKQKKLPAKEQEVFKGRVQVCRGTICLKDRHVVRIHNCKDTKHTREDLLQRSLKGAGEGSGGRCGKYILIVDLVLDPVECKLNISGSRATNGLLYLDSIGPREQKEEETRVRFASDES